MGVRVETGLTIRVYKLLNEALMYAGKAELYEQHSSEIGEGIARIGIKSAKWLAIRAVRAALRLLPRTNLPEEEKDYISKWATAALQDLEDDDFEEAIANLFKVAPPDRY